jgi:hypothetical protein
MPAAADSSWGILFALGSRVWVVRETGGGGGARVLILRLRGGVSGVWGRVGVLSWAWAPRGSALRLGQ